MSKNNLLIFEFFYSSVKVNGLLDQEGSLFVVVVGKIAYVEKASCQEGEPSIKELAVDLGPKTVTIGALVNMFSDMNCPALKGKPKVFLFLDPTQGAISSAQQV
jgi:hypothetical protein